MQLTRPYFKKRFTKRRIAELLLELQTLHTIQKDKRTNKQWIRMAVLSKVISLNKKVFRLHLKDTQVGGQISEYASNQMSSWQHSRLPRNEVKKLRWYTLVAMGTPLLPISWFFGQIAGYGDTGRNLLYTPNRNPLIFSCLGMFFLPRL